VDQAQQGFRGVHGGEKAEKGRQEIQWSAEGKVTGQG
jgi:hypothetical protein